MYSFNLKLAFFSFETICCVWVIKYIFQDLQKYKYAINCKIFSKDREKEKKHLVVYLN